MYKLKETPKHNESENPDIHASDNPDMATEPTDTQTKKNSTTKSESQSTDTSSGNRLPTGCIQQGYYQNHVHKYMLIFVSIIKDMQNSLFSMY